LTKETKEEKAQQREGKKRREGRQEREGKGSGKDGEEDSFQSKSKANQNENNVRI